MSSQSSDNNPSSSETNSNSNGIPQRRASITEYFRPPQYPGPITNAAAQANHRRRMSFGGGNGTGASGNAAGSVTGTSPNPSWFGSYAQRRGSISSVSSTTSSSPVVDNESAVVGENPQSPIDSSTGSFARRLSFGARALRDVKRSMSFGTVGEGEPEQQQQDEYQRRAAALSAAQPMAPPPPPAPQVVKNQPDEVQERMLKGDFYF